MLVVVDNNIYTYNKALTVQPKSFSTKSYFSNIVSSVFRRVNNGNLAFICGSKLVSIFNEEGVLVLKIDGIFDGSYSCSFDETENNSMPFYLISSYNNNNYYIYTFKDDGAMLKKQQSNISSFIARAQFVSVFSQCKAYLLCF